MTLLEGKTVLISGAARGQGRSHALRFAKEGAAVVAFDICSNVPTAGYPLATVADLDETEHLVRAEGGHIVTRVADVRDARQLTEVMDAGVSHFGGIDIVLANAGILGNVGPAWELEDEVFQDVIDINLVGAWRTIKLATPELLRRRGSVVLVSSGMGVKGGTNIVSYVASKHGIIGLMRALAKELAPHGVRVNAVLPGNTDTGMMQNDAARGLYMPDIEFPTREQFAERAASGVPMGIPWVDASDVSEAALWLSSDAARYITGILLPVDGGTAIP
jgi:SDR family mycofactocin-dependent oxidoreductase